MTPAAARRRLIFVVGALMFLLIALPASAVRLTDWLWVREIGFERVFLLRIGAWWGLFLATAAVAFGLLYGTARIALRGVVRPEESIVRLAEGGVSTREKFFTLLAMRLSLPVSIFLAGILGLAAAGSWRTLVQFIYNQGFVFQQLGVASAAAWVLFIIILAITAVQFLGQKKWVHYE